MGLRQKAEVGSRRRLAWCEREDRRYGQDWRVILNFCFSIRAPEGVSAGCSGFFGDCRMVQRTLEPKHFRSLKMEAN